jgi:NTE family protein
MKSLLPGRLLLSIAIMVVHLTPSGTSMENRAPKVALVLSGGGARGAAQIGVLKVLEREGIPVDLIVSTSFGSLVGGLYAIGYKAGEIEQILAQEEWNGIFSNTPDHSLDPLLARSRARYQGELRFKGYLPELPTGLLAGQRLTEILDRLTTERMIAADFDFDKLPISFRSVATNLVNGDKFIFSTGSMTEAIRASSAIPLLFTPVEKDQMLLVDGGLVDNLPTDVARALGAEIVIAVDTTSPLFEKEQIKTFLQVIDQSISLEMRRSVEDNRKQADLVLQPDLDHHTNTDYTKIAEIVQLGAAEAERQLPALKALLAQVPRHLPRPMPVLPAAPVIASVSFEGLKQVRVGQLRHEVNARPGQTLDITVLEQDLRRLYASGLFEHVDFRMTPAGSNNYHLIYVLHEAAMHTLGAAIRYDLDYTFVALAEFSARQVFHTPSTLTLSSQFGGLENHFASLRYVPALRRPFFFITPEFHFSRREYRDFSGTALQDKFMYKQLGAQLMFGTELKRSQIELGFRFDHTNITGGAPPNTQTGTLKLQGVRVSLNRNTLDSQRFPSKGTLLFARADERLKSLGSELDFSRYELDFRHYFALSEKSNIQISGAAGHSRGAVPFYERFYIGGFNFSEDGPRRLIGFDFDELSANQMGILAVSYRYRWFSESLGFLKRSFISGYYNAAAITRQEKRPYNFDLYHGLGAELSCDTMIGPLRLAAGWGQGGRFNIYFTFGPAF